MPFQILRNDITKVKADAIVNTANPLPKYAAGTDAAIYYAAGANELLAERKKLGKIAPGENAVTPAFALRAKYIIHTVGPAWNGGNNGEFEILHSCYRKSMERALELKCKSIAFPLIATGVYGFPKAQALQIALQEINSFLMQDDVDMVVKLVVFDNKAFFQVESYISDEEVITAHMEEYGYESLNDERAIERFRRESAYDFAEDITPEIPIIHSESSLPSATKPFNENTFDKNLYMKDSKDDASFCEHLIKLLNEKNIDNITAYKRANITKGAFSKILCGDTLKPQKKTVLALCIGLQLNIEEAKTFLASADMAFNPYNKRDRLVRDCIMRGQYNIGQIDAMLFICGQPTLGNYGNN